MLATFKRLGAPQAVIDKYNARFEFELFDVNLRAWQVVMLTSPADYHYREQQRGNKVYTIFHGFKSTALAAILGIVKPKRAKRVFRQIRLIEYGALHDG